MVGRRTDRSCGVACSTTAKALNRSARLAIFIWDSQWALLDDISPHARAPAAQSS
jgi:hypothetical protein